MENAWQFSKVYREHLDGFPDSWLEWARKGWADRWGRRYPMGKGAVPEFSFWDGERLDYIDARKRIYVPLYRAAVAKTQAWQLLKRTAESAPVALIDFDGYDYLGLGMTLGGVLNCENRKMGHAFVLAMMLAEEGKVELL